MKKQAQYITIDEALKLLKTNDEILFGMAANEPQELAMNIHRAIDEHGITGIEITNCLPIRTDALYLTDKYVDHISFSSFFYGPTMRKLHTKGTVSFIPNHLHLAAKKRFEYKTYDIFATVASMPDEHGFISLSTCNVYEKKAIKNAKLTIVEVNPNFPRTFGDMEVHVSDIDYLVKTDYAPPVIPDIPLNDIDKKIGSLIAERIEDGSCLQLGIGGMPNAVAEALKGKKDLGIHTEMFTSNMVELIECGAATGNNKQLYPGKHVATFAYGSQKMYDFINNNPSVLLLDGEYVNDPAIIGQNEKQISINAAIEVSLDGQVASESLGTMQFSGTGGQADTAIGAQNSKGGKSFIALYSTAMVKNKETGEREEKSKIVPILTSGAAVTLSRNDVDMVVTEYGVAELKGRNIKETAINLINIAHPKFREELWEQAIKSGFLHERDRSKK